MHCIGLLVRWVPSPGPEPAPPMRSSLRQRQTRSDRDALVLAHLAQADAIAMRWARCYAPLLEKDDLIQIAREALVRAAERCDPDRPAAPYLNSCIRGALHHHLRDGARLVRVPRPVHERGHVPLSHQSLDAPHPHGGSWLDQQPQPANSTARTPDWEALHSVLEQIPAAEAAAIRLTLLRGQTLRQAASQLQTSATSVQRRRRRGLRHLRQQLSLISGTDWQGSSGLSAGSDQQCITAA